MLILTSGCPETHLKLASLYKHHGTLSNKLTHTEAPTTPAPENTQRPQNVELQYGHPIWTRFMKQNLAPSLMIINQKVKVRRPPSHLLVEAEAETSCLRNLGQVPGNQVAIHPDIEGKPLPRFCFQKGVTLCTWRTISRLRADLHCRPCPQW